LGSVWFLKKFNQRAELELFALGQQIDSQVAAEANLTKTFSRKL
jgi:hypothetical protein